MLPGRHPQPRAAGPRWRARSPDCASGCWPLDPACYLATCSATTWSSCRDQHSTAPCSARPGTLPRAVPSDAVVAALARLLPADAVQKGVLLAIFVLACAGTARLLARERMPAQLAAGVLYAWNPFVAERLILGQWATLLGYAGLPWVLAALVKPARGLASRGWLAAAMVPAAIGGFAAMLISGLTAVPVAAAGPADQTRPGGRRRWRTRASS